MEVHHHSHAPKKFKEYITEFIMLFAAVTLGFFAENIREHIVEKEREAKFIEIVHEDINNDIASLHHIIGSYEQRLKREDTLINLLSYPDTKRLSDLYYYARINSIREFFIHSKNGFQQLKNAGGMRMIEDMEVIKKIQAYENSIEKLEELQVLTEQLLMNYREQMAKLFSGVVFRSMLYKPEAKIVYDKFKRPDNNPALLSNNAIELNQLLVKSLYVNNNTNGILVSSKDLLKQAVELETLLSKKYNIHSENK